MKPLLTHTRRAEISFHRDGRITLSAAIVRALGLRPGDAINVMSDGTDYYLYLAHTAAEGIRYAATCRPVQRGNRHFRAFSTRLCAAILDICGQKQCVHLPTGTPVRDALGNTMLPLITRLSKPIKPC